jgi:hypothetical protein
MADMIARLQEAARRVQAGTSVSTKQAAGNPGAVLAKVQRAIAASSSNGK